MKNKTMQTTMEFEELIAPHLVQGGLTAEGLLIAQDWLCCRTGDDRPRVMKRLETLRGLAYNLRETEKKGTTSVLKWKCQLPTEPGWYWRKYNSWKMGGAHDEVVDVVYVRDYAGELAIGNATLKGWHAMEQAEWAGPLLPPAV